MKSKKIFFFIFACLLLISCKSLHTYYQICEVNSTLETSSTGNYKYSDDACSISYDFWGNGGNPGFIFSNNLDEIIYIDLSKSFFIKNGIAHDYYLQRTASISTYSSKNNTTFINTMNEAQEFSILSPHPLIEIAEKAIIAIPPHSSKDISEYVISSQFFYDCENNITPTKKEVPTYKYLSTNSPLTFSNYITYRIGDNTTEHSFINSFYVSSVSFYHNDAAITKVNIGCPNQRKEVEVVKGASPRKFYIRYTIESNVPLKSSIKGPKGNVKHNLN